MKTLYSLLVFVAIAQATSSEGRAEINQGAFSCRQDLSGQSNLSNAQIQKQIVLLEERANQVEQEIVRRSSKDFKMPIDEIAAVKYLEGLDSLGDTSVQEFYLNELRYLGGRLKSGLEFLYRVAIVIKRYSDYQVPVQITSEFSYFVARLLHRNNGNRWRDKMNSLSNDQLANVYRIYQIETEKKTFLGSLDLYDYLIQVAEDWVKLTKKQLLEAQSGAEDKEDIQKKQDEVTKREKTLTEKIERVPLQMVQVWREKALALGREENNLLLNLAPLINQKDIDQANEPAWFAKTCCGGPCANCPNGTPWRRENQALETQLVKIQPSEGTNVPKVPQSLLSYPIYQELINIFPDIKPGRQWTEGVL